MAAAPLGNCRCPLCGGLARASLSKNQLAVITCTQPDCGIQLFTRSEAADERARALIVTAPAPAAAPADEPPAVVIVGEPPVEVKEPGTAPPGWKEAAEARAQRSGFGLNWF